jgi:hypothetical protein
LYILFSALIQPEVGFEKSSTNVPKAFWGFSSVPADCEGGLVTVEAGVGCPFARGVCVFVDEPNGRLSIKNVSTPGAAPSTTHIKQRILNINIHGTIDRLFFDDEFDIESAVIRKIFMNG